MWEDCNSDINLSNFNVFGTFRQRRNNAFINYHAQDNMQIIVSALWPDDHKRTGRFHIHFLKTRVAEGNRGTESYGSVSEASHYVNAWYTGPLGPVS